MTVLIVTNIGTLSGIRLPVTLSFSGLRVFGHGLTFLRSFKVVSVVITQRVLLIIERVSLVN